MSTRWTHGDARVDVSDQHAERNDEMAAEAMDYNLWPDDERPTRAEIERDEFENWRWDRANGWTP